MSDQRSLVSFDQYEAAEALASRLSKEGFEASAMSDSAEQLLKFYTPHPRAHCHVVVPNDQAETAMRRLMELDATEQVLKSAIRCPECGSTGVTYPQFSHKTIIGALPSLAAAAGIIDRQFFCESCQFTWAPAVDPVKEVPAGKDALR